MHCMTYPQTCQSECLGDSLRNQRMSLAEAIISELEGGGAVLSCMCVGHSKGGAENTDNVRSSWQARPNEPLRFWLNQPLWEKSELRFPVDRLPFENNSHINRHSAVLAFNWLEKDPLTREKPHQLII